MESLSDLRLGASFTTANVETMEGMFLLTNLTSLDVSGFNVEKVQNF